MAPPKSMGYLRGDCSRNKIVIGARDAQVLKFYIIASSRCIFNILRRVKSPCITVENVGQRGLRLSGAMWLCTFNYVICPKSTARWQLPQIARSLICRLIFRFASFRRQTITR